MDRYRAIPEGYMTVGEVAKKMGVSVRTLQYYDREGLLSPSAESDGGRRLYTEKDVVRLHQILSLKSLGFSLEEIGNSLSSLETPEDVAEALSRQAELLREKIEGFSRALNELEALREEVLQMRSVDFKKYADIIVNLQMRNENYRFIKYFDGKLLDHIRSRFDRESGLSFIRRFSGLLDEAISLRGRDISPDGEAGITLAGRFWTLIGEFTGGDVGMLSELMKFSEIGAEGPDWQKWREANLFLGPALEAYFRRTGADPFGGERP